MPKNSEMNVGVQKSRPSFSAPLHNTDATISSILTEIIAAKSLFSFAAVLLPFFFPVISTVVLLSAIKVIYGDR